MRVNFQLLGPLMLLVVSGCGTSEVGGNDPKSGMFELVHREAIRRVMHHIDRPFDAKFEQASLFINPDDPSLAFAIFYGSYRENGVVVRKLFLVMFENDSPSAYATQSEELACLLVNAGGKVLERDESYWSTLPEDAQQQAGAVDTDGPPFAASMYLELGEQMSASESSR